MVNYITIYIYMDWMEVARLSKGVFKYNITPFLGDSPPISNFITL